MLNMETKIASINITATIGRIPNITAYGLPEMMRSSAISVGECGTTYLMSGKANRIEEITPNITIMPIIQPVTMDKGVRGNGGFRKI